MIARGAQGAPTVYSANDDRHLLASIRLSEHAAEAGNYPFAAILVNGVGETVVEAENSVATDRDATAHAEVNLVRAATRILGADELAASTLYVSAEPCAMCAGAICWSNIGRVVHSLGSDALAEIVLEREPESLALRVPSREVFDRCAHRIEVVGPHREEESRAVHDRFWRKP